MKINILALTAVMSLTFLTGCQQLPARQSVQPLSASTQPSQQQAPLVEFRLAQAQAREGLNSLKLKDNTLYFTPDPVLTRGDLAGVTPMKSKQGQAFVNLRFTPAGAQKLAQVSGQNVGKWLVFTINNQLVGIPRLTHAVTNGNLNLTMSSEQEAINVADAIAGRVAGSNSASRNK
ncbi:SecDF P1 head subdomain-containing protein [Serratia ficaria]|uniref:SecDF P1 head subdomain-containing protein n=1 Tax=Serratia ficaria TaxID=61651 RepID=UPI00077C717E|nr:hypothetical protein [Serratia ficaria]VVA47983.1 preprotein translocase subunit SecD [Serratia ficaria]